MPDVAPLWSEETMEEAARVLADALHANEPGTPYDLAEAVLNSAGVRREVQAARNPAPVRDDENGGVA